MEILNLPYRRLMANPATITKPADRRLAAHTNTQNSPKDSLPTKPLLYTQNNIAFAVLLL